MFACIEGMLPPFKEYIEYMFVEKQSQFIPGDKEGKANAYSLIVARLFDKTDDDNIETESVFLNLTKIVADTMVREMENKKKDHVQISVDIKIRIFVSTLL